MRHTDLEGLNPGGIKSPMNHSGGWCAAIGGMVRRLAVATWRLLGDAIGRLMKPGLLAAVRSVPALAALTVAGMLAGAPRPADAQSSQPNIVMFMVDDMGWVDCTTYGSQYYETPNIERLAARGRVFTNAYTANPLCSPTRASIMTGKYPGRLNMTTPAGHLAPNPGAPPINESGPAHQKVVTPNTRNQLEPSEYTVAEGLKDAGYDTVFLGKWHLGAEDQYWPHNQGFDINIAGMGHPGPPSYFSPYNIALLPDGPAGEYITDRLTDEAVSYLQGRSGDPDPFFMCFWHFAVHAPYQGQEALIDPYRSKTDPRGYQDCPTMGAMIEAMDSSLGRLLDTLDAEGMTSDTIIVFFSDNGGNMYDTVTDPVTLDSTTPTNNAPLRSGKGNIYEGGHRVPCIVAWPDVVAPDTVDDQALLTSIDWYPTIMDWGGATTQTGQIVDGISLVDYLEHGTPLNREAIFNHFPHYVPATENLPATSVRRGDYKLIRYYGEGPDRTHAYELYNLATDIGETNNLADSMPALVAELDALITQHLNETGAVIPFPNPAWSEPIGGWQSMNNMLLSQGGGFLRTQLLSGDPHMQVAEDINLTAGIKVKIRMRIMGSGQLQLFWQTPTLGYAAVRSELFDLTHDGTWFELNSAAIPDDVRRIRIDPGVGLGAADFDWIRIYNETETQLLASWEFGGDWDGSPFVPYSPHAGWSADNHCTMTDFPGYTRINISDFDPFISSGAFDSHPGPVKVELRLRSGTDNAGLASQFMWANSEGSFGIAAGRGMNFNQNHSGDWELYTLDIATPDVFALRFDPLHNCENGDHVDVDWIRLLAADGSTVLEQWDFGLAISTQSEPERWARYR